MMGSSGDQRLTFLERSFGFIHPRVAAIGGLEEELPRHVDHRRIVRRNLDRRVPVEAQRIEVGRRVDDVGRAAASAAARAAADAAASRTRAFRSRPAPERSGRRPGCRRAELVGGCRRRAASAARVGPDALLRAGAQVVPASCCRPATRRRRSPNRWDPGACRNRRRRRP